MDRIELHPKCLRHKYMNIVEVVREKNANFLSNIVGNEYWFS